MSDKMTKKELQQPDAFQKVGAGARDWLAGRQQTIAVAVVAVLLIGLGFVTANYFSERGQVQASKALGEALRVLERPVEGDFSSGPPEPGQTPFKTQRERDEATHKALTEFRNQHKGTRSATMAALPLGQVEYRLGQHEQALTTLNEFLKDAPAADPLRASAMETRGYVHEAQGKLDEALAAFDQLAKEHQSEFLNGMGLFHRGRILALQDKKAEAAKAFAEIAGAFPNSAAARMSKDRLAALAAAGISPPPVPAATPDAG